MFVHALLQIFFLKFSNLLPKVRSGSWIFLNFQQHIFEQSWLLFQIWERLSYNVQVIYHIPSTYCILYTVQCTSVHLPSMRIIKQVSKWHCWFIGIFQDAPVEEDRDYYRKYQPTLSRSKQPWTIERQNLKVTFPQEAKPPSDMSTKWQNPQETFQWSDKTSRHHFHKITTPASDFSMKWQNLEESFPQNDKTRKWLFNEVTKPPGVISTKWHHPQVTFQ